MLYLIYDPKALQIIGWVNVNIKYGGLVRRRITCCGAALTITCSV